MEDFKEHRLFTELRLLYSGTEEYPNTMRFMVQIKDKINLESYSYAINMIKKRYPYLCVELKKDDNGFYFIKNERDFIVGNINKDIILNSEESNYHLMSFQYSDDNYIIVNISHAIADGNTAYSIIRTLLYYYITDSYKVELSKENIRLVGDVIDKEEFEDPFLSFKKLVKPTQNNYSKCLNIVKDNNFDQKEKLLYHLTIDEKELMEYVKSIKATPGTLLILLLAKAIKKENPSSNNVIRMNLCVDLRKLLNTPLAHQCLVSGIFFDYDEKLINMNLEDEIKTIREIVKDSLQEPQSLEKLSTMYFLQSMLAKEKDMNKIKQLSNMINTKAEETLTASLSYVGKANFGDSEKYITDFKTIANTRHAILIELAAVNGKFYLEFIQNFCGGRYFDAFKEELDNLKIKYEFKEPQKFELPKMKQVL